VVLKLLFPFSDDDKGLGLEGIVLGIALVFDSITANNGRFYLSQT